MSLAPNTGPGWSIVTSPDTSTTDDNYLNDVTCTSASDCWAVGYYYNASSVAQTLVLRYTASPGEITLNGKKVEKVVYTYNAGTSSVTGKPLDLVGVRYYIPKDSATLAVVAYGIVSNQYDPQGADDIATTFQWQ